MTTDRREAGAAADEEVVRYVEVPGVGDPRRFGYAQAVSAGGLLFVSGQLGIDEDYKPVSDSFDEQAYRAMENVRRVLSAAGGGMEHLVSMTIYLTDMRNAPRFFDIRREILGEILVSSTAVAVSGLPLPNLQVEVQCVAHIPPSQPTA
ncbi:RidA family protein [Streptomyces sp. NBS 14/10]|uniref:RidA family protein n=1 Tax=Streptomyces sp. NBS 14/10 TaxID=1945643 RepID=UPI000B7E7271|nr:RidA family protein [Streptomyces sp. NBS 14/10]KAK1182747.1 RidA family protein [Streptomyces sp. NBS 14/10]NUS83428.1 RidA family protein [Streptomyces sp.]